MAREIGIMTSVTDVFNAITSFVQHSDNSFSISTIKIPILIRVRNLLFDTSCKHYNFVVIFYFS